MATAAGGYSALNASNAWQPETTGSTVEQRGHGGRITIESEGTDHGTTVQVYWPCLPAAP